VQLGVVIPARNEEKTLGRCLLSIEPFLLAGDAVVVVDDGSTDATVSVCKGVRVLRSTVPGRGHAVAAGVEAVRRDGGGVVILHADMEVPADARAAILDVLERAPAGYLGHRIADPRFRFRVVEAGNALRARWRRLPYGDQGQFFRTSILEAIGGFPDQERLEDLELALRLRAAGPVLDARSPVTIPPRHWDSGILRAFVRNTRTVARYRRNRVSSPPPPRR
jgi:glycosyltransferase involved in cell wall biosynthesis